MSRRRRYDYVDLLSGIALFVAFLVLMAYLTVRR